MGTDGATAGMPNTQKGTSTPSREEENCRAEAMVWPPDGGSTGGVTAAGQMFGIIGGLLGRKILKKHFAKAGIV